MQPPISDSIQQQLDIPGAHQFLPQRDGLIFRVNTKGPLKAANGASHVKITLDHKETYTVGFYKFNPQFGSLRKITVIPDVPCDRITAAVLYETQISSPD